MSEMQRYKDKPHPACYQLRGRKLESDWDLHKLWEGTYCPNCRTHTYFLPCRLDYSKADIHNPSSHRIQQQLLQTVKEIMRDAWNHSCPWLFTYQTLRASQYPIHTMYSTDTLWHNTFHLFFSFPVLSIHKRPTAMTTDFTFPVKGWRGMMDWVRTSEEKITVSRDALSIDQSGENGIHTVFR